MNLFLLRQNLSQSVCSTNRNIFQVLPTEKNIRAFEGFALTIQYFTTFQIANPCKVIGVVGRKPQYSHTTLAFRIYDKKNSTGTH